MANELKQAYLASARAFQDARDRCHNLRQKLDQANEQAWAAEQIYRQALYDYAMDSNIPSIYLIFPDHPTEQQ